MALHLAYTDIRSSSLLYLPPNVINKVRRATTQIRSDVDLICNGDRWLPHQRTVFITGQSIITGSGLYDYQVTGSQEWLPNPGSDSVFYADPRTGVTAIFRPQVDIDSFATPISNDISKQQVAVTLRSRTRVIVTPTFITGTGDRASLNYGGSSIKFDSIGIGETWVTIKPSKWSDFIEIIPGSYITSIDNFTVDLPKALFVGEPQFKSGRTKVNITVPFSRDEYANGEWQINIPDGTNFNDEIYTPSYFRSSDLLRQYMENFRDIVVSESEYASERMKDFRRWDRISDEYASPLALTMGMSIRLDRFNAETKRRAIHEWIGFTQLAGTRSFIDFEGYVIDTIFDIDHLWTQDYRNFVSRAEDPTEVFYPNYYPTNHVNVTYEVEKYDIYDPDDIRYIYDMFYKLASVPLVLEGLIGYMRDNTKLFMEGAGHETEYLPIDGNDLPANFWIIGSGMDIEMIVELPNIMPPNFWIIGAGHDMEIVIEEATINIDALPLISARAIFRGEGTVKLRVPIKTFESASFSGSSKLDVATRQIIRNNKATIPGSGSLIVNVVSRSRIRSSLAGAGSLSVNITSNAARSLFSGQGDLDVR